VSAAAKFIAFDSNEMGSVSGGEPHFPHRVKI
jgi:hypothetical protein